MNASSSDATPEPSRRQGFMTTRWSVVLAARDPDSPRRDSALETLCQAYWYPLYAYVRRVGHPPHDAQDLTQEFFARLLARDYLRAADPEKGRFRSFLLIALRRFLANEWDRARAQKRGGGRANLPLDLAESESRYTLEPASEDSADRLYERRWALTLVERAMSRLRAEHESAGRIAEFEALKIALTAGRGGVPYAELSRTLRQSEGAVRVAVHRLRRRFRDLFREEVAATVADPADTDSELTQLMEILSKS
jgi:RNA polymerase sigma factor (sigma-70 family)